MSVVTEAVNECACRWNLDLIGPNRADAIGYEIQGTGFVWSALERSVAMDLVRTHMDTLIDPGADLAPLAEEMVEAFLSKAKEDEDGGVLIEFIEHFDGKLRFMIKEQDVLPSLEEMRRKLLRTWDG